MSFSIRPQSTPLGPVHVRMTGIVRGDQKGPGIGIVNAPTAAEATAELHRVARVAGADKVVSVAADYRRAALAGGTTSTQWRIEVQAWGTAMAPPKPEATEEPDESQRQEADRARDDEAAKRARDAQSKAETTARADESSEAEARKVHEQAAARPAEASAPASAPAPSPPPRADAAPSAETTPAPPPAEPAPSPER